MLFSSVCYGQAIIKTIKETNPKYKEYNYVFPFVSVPGKKNVANKVNDYLVSDLLDIDRRKVKKSIFEHLWPTKEKPMSGLSDFSYEVLCNTKKFLSLSISAEGCGAYCEHFTSYYLFDFKTGERIKLTDLLSKEGLDQLVDSINIKKKKLLETTIKGMQDSLANQSGQLKDYDRDYLEEALLLYQDCLANQQVSSIEYVKFYITKDMLFTSTGRCSAHVNRALDDIGDFDVEFALADWKKYLTAYAKVLVTK